MEDIDGDGREEEIRYDVKESGDYAANRQRWKHLILRQMQENRRKLWENQLDF